MAVDKSDGTAEFSLVATKKTFKKGLFPKTLTSRRVNEIISTVWSTDHVGILQPE